VIARTLALAMVLLLFSGGARADDATAPAMFLDERGTWQPIRASYQTWLPMQYRTPKVLRSTVETLAWLGLGTAYYWVDPLANSVDWDYPTVQSKLAFETVRFDNNLFATNHVLHPLAGTAFYGFSRVNGLSPAASFLDAALASILWEFTIEYREQASVNDIIFTPFGGMAIGEFLFQLGDYLNSAPDGGGPGNRIAALTLGLPQHVHDDIDGFAPPRTPPEDSLGFSSAYAHRFVAGYMTSFVDGVDTIGDSLHGFVLEAWLGAMPGFLRPGRFSVPFSDGNFVEMRAEAGWGAGETNRVDLWFMSSLAGKYFQDLNVSPSGKLRGSAALLALSTALRYDERDLLDRHDRFAIAHLLGPNAAVWVAESGLLTSLDVDIHGDFAAIHPAALETWQARYSTTETKTVLERHGYVFAWGFSTRARTRLEFEPVELSSFVGYGIYDSVQGMDRQQFAVTRDQHITDKVLEYGMAFGLAPPETPLLLRAGIDTLKRSGSMGGFASAWREHRFTGTAALSF
jgi:hypothetical protein